MKVSLPSATIQIAGVRDQRELALILQAGVRFVGFPLRLAYHLPDTSEAIAARIIAGCRPHFEPVLITYEEDVHELVSLADRLQTRWVQLHSRIDPRTLRELQRRAPHLSIIKSIIIPPEPRISEILAYAQACEPFVQAFITDTFDPATGACGATGKVHDWQVSALLVRRLRRPLILAGGLNPENVRRAIQTVRPHGVDAHTGVEDAQGYKSPRLLHRFVAAARTAFPLIRY